MSASTPKAIAFFDVDHTLVCGNSGYFTSLRLIQNKILKKRRLVQAVYYSLAAVFRKQDIQKIYEIAIKDMAGIPLEKVLEIGRECFHAEVRPRLYIDALKKIEEHRKMGDIIVLMTSAPYMLIKILQEYIQADEAYCMGPVIVDGILGKQVQLPICHGVGKVHYAEMEAKKYGIPLSDCYFYTDSHSDLPLLEKVGHPRIVNPTKKLKTAAQKHGWPVSYFRETTVPKKGVLGYWGIGSLGR